MNMYTVEEKIGEGGYAKIYRVVEQDLSMDFDDKMSDGDKKMAIKVLTCWDN